MKNIVTKTVLSLLILTAVFADAVENSVIPTMEAFECIENLPSQKFTKNQFNEISKALEKKDEMIRLVTYNMLFNLYDHNLAEENRWPNRLPRVVELVREMRPDIIATQELYPAQVRDVVDLIGDDFALFNGMRDQNGESYGIFYRKDRFELLSSRFENPLAMVQLKDLKTGKIILISNTHMPFNNIEFREENTHKICEILEPLAEQMAVIFAGDLNTFPARLNLTGLPFYDGDYIHRILSKGALKDSHGQSLIGHFGPISTFTNTDSKDSRAFQGTGVPGIILDYIYVSNKVTVLAHAVEPGTVDGHFPSDHLPVLIDFIIN